jgi:hypothetical protein
MSRVVVLAALAVASDAFMPALVPGLAPPLLAVMPALLSLGRECAPGMNPTRAALTPLTFFRQAHQSCGHSSDQHCQCASNPGKRSS